MGPIQHPSLGPKKFPLVVYKDGVRIIVGECELEGELQLGGDEEHLLSGVTIINAQITDPEISEKILGSSIPEGSMSIGMADNTEVRRNIFDIKKKD